MFNLNTKKIVPSETRSTLQSQLSIVTTPALSVPWRMVYFSMIVSIITVVAIFQGWLTRQNENDLISDQAKAQCNVISQNIEAAYLDVQLFSKTIATAFFADNLHIHDAIFNNMLEIKSTDEILGLASLQYVEHVPNEENMDLEHYLEHIDANEEDSHDHEDEDEDEEELAVHTFDNVPVPDNLSRYDIITYQTRNISFLNLFYPYPEPLRDQAIDTAIESGKITCSAKIDLVEEKDSGKIPRGVLCFVPLYMRNGLSVKPENRKEANVSVKGFVNPVMKMDDVLANVIESGIASVDISLIEVLLFDTTDDVDNIENWEGYLASYPRISLEEYNKVEMKSSQYFLSHHKAHTMYQKTFSIGSRNWTVHCGLNEKFYNDSQTYLPYLIGGLSFLISFVLQLLKYLMKKCVYSTQKHYSRYSSRRSNRSFNLSTSNVQ